MQRVIENLTRAIQQDSGNSDWYFLRAHAYGEVELHLNAIDDLSQAIWIDPTAPVLYMGRASASGDTGQYTEEAADLCESLFPGH